jgi:threonine dehydrogenase-like Zn-dependent dehydrogenase
MPPIFKAFITIAVWVLFIEGLLASLVGCLTVGMAVMRGAIPPIGNVAVSAAGVAALILACVAAWLRQKVG